MENARRMENKQLPWFDDWSIYPLMLTRLLADRARPSWLPVFVDDCCRWLLSKRDKSKQVLDFQNETKNAHRSLKKTSWRKTSMRLFSRAKKLLEFFSSAKWSNELWYPLCFILTMMRRYRHGDKVKRKREKKDASHPLVLAKWTQACSWYPCESYFKAGYEIS